MPSPPLDANGFPVDPVVEDLPAGLSEKERHEFAFRIMAEQGERIGDYLIAAVNHVTRPDGADFQLLGRWLEMVDLVQEIHGAPLTLTYNHCARQAAEDAARRDN